MAAKKAVSSMSYRFRLVRAGTEFEVEGDRQFVLEFVGKFAPMLDDGAKVKSTHHSVEAPTHKETERPSGKGTSIREFIRSFELTKHTDYVLAFGYYLEKHAGIESFTPADINNLYYEAKLDSSNTSQMLIQNIKRGYVMEAKNSDGGRKRYVVTNSGENYIEQKRVAVANG